MTSSFRSWPNTWSIILSSRYNLPFLSDPADEEMLQGKSHPSVSRVGHAAGPLAELEKTLRY